MTMVEMMNGMKAKIREIYGEDSHEAGYIQWVFAKRDTNTFIEVYEDMMAKARKEGR